MASEDTKNKAVDLAARVEEPIHEAHQILQGQVPGNPDKALGHPIHPATVHWPIAVSLDPITCPSPILLVPGCRCHRYRLYYEPRRPRESRGRGNTYQECFTDC